jgi:hypothetical protein
VGREIERYVREREEEMRKQQGGWQELLVWFYTTGDWGRRCKQTEVPPGVNISWYRRVGSRGYISMVQFNEKNRGSKISWHCLFLSAKHFKNILLLS